MGELFSLKDKIAVVTGGSGILGSEFVKTLRSAGAKVAVFELQERGSDDQSVRYYKVDITDKEAITAALEEIKKSWGVPHILVNSAAIDAPPDYSNPIKSGLLESEDAERRFERVMEVNVKGTLLCSQAIGNEMAKSGRGSIINISSIYGEGSPDQRIYIKKDPSKSFIKPISYCVSKGAIPNLTRYLAAYWASKGVRVNTLTFGGVFNDQDPEFVEKYCAKVPLGRMAKRDEYNGALLFLSSDASSYMTGANMIIDGGYTSW